CAETLGVRYDIVPIGAPVDAVNENLAKVFEGRAPDITEENLQSRMRGTILMAVSNKLGSLLITTGNKSEMAVGYATIYGDMNGAYNPIKDMLKMQVYGLAEWRNSYYPTDVRGPAGVVIPPEIISKAPSAELRPDQTDQDSLPPYPVLDAIIEALIEEELSLAEIVAKGFDADLVKRIERLIYVAEFKRRQSAPGPKLTAKAFGIGRKYPITSGVVVRYAPSPTGRLHLGNARPLILNWLFARKNSGKFILRFDDTDTARSTEAFAKGIEADLDWLGILPDIKVRQSDRLDLYDVARDRLIADGRLYPAYETADELDRKR
ncbi:nadE, partial [Symbiodinium necroappetens]